MKNTTTARLIEAAKWIAQYENSELSMIQFEDGSGKNFNYTVAKTGRKKFITWDQLCIGLGYNPDNLCTTSKFKGIWDEATNQWLNIDDLNTHKSDSSVSEAEFDDLLGEAFKQMEEKEPETEYVYLIRIGSDPESFVVEAVFSSLEKTLEHVNSIAKRPNVFDNAEGNNMSVEEFAEKGFADEGFIYGGETYYNDGIVINKIPLNKEYGQPI
jgi:hypothetical protein